MNKSDYMAVCNEHGFGFHSWLSVLPLYGQDGKPVTLKHPVPIVVVPIGTQAPAGFKFQWSTIHAIVPDGYQTRALVKDR